MKSRRFIKEKLPEGQKSSVISRKYKNNLSSTGSKEYTVKETTIEKTFETKYNTGGRNDTNLTSKMISSSSSLKQGTNSGFISQNKIPVSAKEESKVGKFHKYKAMRNSNESYKIKKYTKKESDMIIKIQRWWRRILAKLNGYKIREKLKKEKNYGYSFKNTEVIKSTKVVSSNSTQNKSSNSNYKSNNNNNNINIKKFEYNSNNKYNSNINKNNNYNNNNYNNKNLYNSVNSNSSSYTNINSYSNNYLQKNQNSKSYTNIKSINSNIKKNLNENAKLTTSSSQNYIQTINKKIITSGSPKIAQSVSTSPSTKSKYIIETKKVEIFKKPKNYSENKAISKSMASMSEINRYEVKEIMKSIWNEESYCSTVESLCCLSDDNKSNISQNTFILEEYEEEIRKLNTLLLEKDNELNHLITELRDTKNQLNVNISKKTQIQSEYITNKKDFDQDAHELQIISLKKTDWNQVNLPSPVNEIYIESFKTDFGSKLAYMENMEKYAQKIKTEESVQESITEREAILEIQEMNALSIISNKIRPKNICQHLQSLSIFSKRNEEPSEEREPLIFQKIEEINITSIASKPKNQIQELDGLEIINMKRSNIKEKYELKRKIRNIPQNVDKICIKSLYKKKEVHNMIQELDGLEIIKSAKKPNIPQCVDELEIQREYDMLLVKPTWNSLQIEGSGLNLLAMTRDMGLENQEVDEFEILGLDKPELYIQPQDKMSILKPKITQKIQVLIPVAENSIRKGERFNIKGIKKKAEVKYIERFIDKSKKTAPNEIEQIETIELLGEEKIAEIQIEQKEIEVSVNKKTVPNVIRKLDRFVIKSFKKEDYTPVKRKGFVEKINKKVITKKEEKKEEIIKEPLIIDSIESFDIEKEYETVKPIVLEKIDWNKMTRPMKTTKLTIKNQYEKVSVPKQIIKKEEIKTIERVYKNWNDEIKPIKTTKLIIKGIKKLWDSLDIEGKDTFNLVYQKEKEELIEENFAFNLLESSTKGIVLKEGPAPNIQINKEIILLPSKNERFGLIHEQKVEPKIEKKIVLLPSKNERFSLIYEMKIVEKIEPKIEKKIVLLPSKSERFGLIHKIKKIVLSPSKNERFDLINEIKKVELKSVHENRLFIKGTYTIKTDSKEKIKIIEKIIEKKINWNEFNIKQHSELSLIHKKTYKPLVKQRSNSVTLLGVEFKQPEPKIIQKEKIVTVEVSKNWNNLHAQRNAKFGLIGKTKPVKKLKLLVANGDKFFIQKESDDEIIYNDDYNTRKLKQKTAEKEKDKKEIRTQIIKEREIVPRYQREIRAQIARVKESESETSSMSEIDVLAGIRTKKTIAKGGTDINKMKMANGYQIKELNGEVVFTAKNGLGVNLGGVQYQKQVNTKVGYTKKFSDIILDNDMTGIEFSFNPNMKTNKNEIYYQKMTASTGTIGEGNYKIITNEKNIKMKKGLGNSSSYKQMKVFQSNGINDVFNGNIDNNGQTSIKKQIIITSTNEENNNTNNINGQPLINNVIVNNKLNQSPMSSGINGNLNKRPSQNSGNNYSNYSRGNQSPVSANINYDINQQMKSGKIIFNSKIKTDKGQYSTNSAGNMSGKGNVIVNSRKEYEKKINNVGDINIQDGALNDKKKNVEIKFKRSKVKKVEPLRDIDSQKSF